MNKFLFLLTLYFFICSDIHSQCSHPDYEALMEIFEALNGHEWSDSTGWKEGASGVNCDPCTWTGIYCQENRVLVIRIHDEDIIGIHGELPSINIPTLTSLSINCENVSGTVPNFSHMNNLRYISIANTKLDGTMPTLADSLERIEIYNNDISGPLPDYSGFQNLEILLCHSNKLDGEIPLLHNLPELYTLNISGNLFTGSIPNFDLPRLNSLFCLAPTLDGPVPDFNLLPSLRTLHVSGSKFPDFSQLYLLSRLIIEGTDSDESIPEFAAMTYLRELTIQGEFGGEIPDLSSYLLWDLTISGQHLTGLIPDFSRTPKLESLVISNASITGPIPNFKHLRNLEFLTITNCKKIESDIPDFFYIPHVKSLHLNNNTLGGEIPDFAYLPGIENLTLSKNKLEGKLPSFSNCPTLKTIKIDSNKIVGTIPEFESLNNLEDLDLSHNLLSGLIHNFEGSKKLRSLNLGNNNLSGEIPEFRLFKLKSIALDSNQFTGIIPELWLSPDLESLILNGNDLSGCYPLVHCRLVDVTSSSCLEKPNLGCTYDFRHNKLLPWEGDYERYCVGEEQHGAACDDGNDQTVNDAITGECECIGQGIDQTKEIDKLSVSIYPNPSSETIKISSARMGLKYQLYNIQGKVMLAGKVSEEGIDLSHLAVGYYIIELSDNGSDKKEIQTVIKI